jgi:hypothetical protein
MQFLMMCCFEEARWESLPQAQRDGIMGDYGAFIEGIKKSGHYLAGAKLDQSARAVTIREQHGKAAIKDGPFAETKEQLGGYHLVECENLDEAISLAKRIPTLRVGGTVEVRAVHAQI